MTTETKILLATLSVVAVAVVVLFVAPQAAEKLAPVPKAAWLAVEVEGEEAAVVGARTVPAGTPFRMHAVLEAEDRNGETLYYTEASGLVVDGEAVPAEALRRWDRRQTVKVLWFTVEGNVPYLAVDRVEDYSRFKLTEFIRQDLPRSWSVPGRVALANSEQLVLRPGEVAPHFGIVRYHIRIEIYHQDNPLVPMDRFRSPGMEDLRREPASFPDVRVALPDGLEAPSLFFGLTHLQPSPAVRGELGGELAELTRKRLAYAPVPLLAELLAAAGRGPEDLSWERVDLAAGPAWGDGVSPGDLLRAGSRWVVLYEDRGVSGLLDPKDLCLDFARGSAIFPLNQVFVSEGGEVELARL